jgi:tetratricopeptide (TPR) repeat protein
MRARWLIFALSLAAPPALAHTALAAAEGEAAPAPGAAKGSTKGKGGRAATAAPADDGAGGIEGAAAGSGDGAAGDAKATGSPAEGPPKDGDEATERLSTYANEGRWGEIFVRSEEWAKAFPDHFGPRHFHGLLLMATNQTDAAIAEFREVVRLLPTFADGHLRLGLALTLLGDDEAARGPIQKALELEADNEEAKLELAAIGTRARLRASVKGSPPTASTPEATAWDALDRVAGGDLGGAMERYLDPALIDRVFDSVGAPKRGRDQARRDFYRGASEGVRRRGAANIVGWELAPAGENDGTSARIRATVLTVQTTSEAEVVQQLATLDSPLADKVLAADVLAIYRSLPRPVVEASFRRVIGREVPALATVDFDMRKSGDRWLIADANIDIQGTANLKLSVLAENSRELIKLGGGDPDRLSRSPFGRGVSAGIGLGILGAVIGVVMMLIRRART